MTFKRLTIQTRKSLSGLYSSSNNQSFRVLETATVATKKTSSQSHHNSPDESGMLSSENTSPVRDSPSRRSRLLGSLRSIGSLRSLRTPHSHSKHSQSDDSPSEAELLGTPCKQMPPLFLDFEVSPPDKPMFDTASRTVSSASSLEVRHSSPITMAQSNRKHLGASLTPAKLSPFIIGGPPDSPAPLQRALVQESIFFAAPTNETTEHSPTSQNCVLKDSVSTPMPGTNLTLEDAVAPGIAAEGATTTSLRHDYFKAIPTEDAYQEHADSTVPSDPLSMEDPKFDEMMGKTGAEVPSDTYQAWPKHPGSKKLRDTTVSATDKSQALASFRTRFHQYTVSQGSADTEKLPKELAYLFWNDSAATIEGIDQQERQPRAWNFSPDLSNSDAHGLTIPPRSARVDSFEHAGEISSAGVHEVREKLLHYLDEQCADDFDEAVVQPGLRTSADVREELRTMIRSYAGPMLYRDDSREEQAPEFTGELPADGDARIGDKVKDEMKAEVELATRVMNRSLGG